MALTRDEKLRINAHNKMMAEANGKVAPEQYQYKVRAPRVLKPRNPANGPTEAQILKAIMSLLRTHPKVARVWRQNSMTAKFEGANGKTRFVRANTARGMSDIAGVLKSGRSIFIEVKTVTGDIADHQQAFIDDMARAGALAFFARSVDDVVAQLRAV